MEPYDADTDQNNTFDDKTSNIISSDDIPVADEDQVSQYSILFMVKFSYFTCHYMMLRYFSVLALFFVNCFAYVFLLKCGLFHLLINSQLCDSVEI